MNRLLLIDGHNLLCKAFYGIPEKLRPDGTSVHGVIGFIGMLLKISKSIDPTHILVVFDPEEQPSRVEQYAEYKQNRRDFSDTPARENPFSQLVDILKALDRLSITHVMQPGYEADDMIASYAVQSDCEAVITSSDTDFLQLICDRIRVFRYQGKKSVVFNVDEVQRKYGLHPSRFLEYKALIGDKTDNIGGIKGVGPKTALKILNGEKELTEDEKDIFERNLGLIRLNTEIELPRGLSELICNDGLKEIRVGPFLRGIGVF